MLPLRLPTVVPAYLRDPFWVPSCSASISRRLLTLPHSTVLLQQYADDTQLYITCSVNNAASPLSTLESCLASLHCWFCHNGLTLSPSKSEAIIFGTCQHLNSFLWPSGIHVVGSPVSTSDHITTLGVTLDSNLTLNYTFHLHAKQLTTSLKHYVILGQYLHVTWPGQLQNR